MSFDSALNFVLAREGGLSDNPADPGGRTNHGITQHVYDAWQDRVTLPHGDVATIPMETVKAIYLDQYWTASGAEGLPDGPALAVFDSAVNLGVLRARTLWQEADGDVQAFLWLRLRHYDDVVRTRPDMAQFLHGWVRRLILLREAIS